MIDINKLSDQSEDQLIGWLKHCDDLYENDPAQLTVDDSTYDRVRRYAQVAYPANEYFIGVGADVRGGKIDLAYAMNGLLQKYATELQPWIDLVYQCGGTIVDSDKLDGVSAQIIYDSTGSLQKSFSRGNGLQAADTTRHLRKLLSVPQQLPSHPLVTGTLPIRAEIIISKSNWLIVKDKFRKRDGSQYANARAAVSSIMNSSTNPDEIYKYVDCVAYTIIDSPLSKLEQFALLSELGFKVPRFDNSTAKQSEDYYNDQIPFVKSTSDYELDGIVLDVNTSVARKSVHNSGQAISIKFKVTDVDNVATATVKQVVYTASKHGLAKPRVEIHPISLCGVTITYATGFNAKFIVDNGIGPGAKVKITRSGDVIPYIMDVLYKVSPQLPDESFGDWEWNATNVDIVLKNIDDNADVAINKLTDTFTKLKIAGLKQGNVVTLMNAGFNTVESILTIDYTDAYMTLGENGKSIYNSIEERLSDIYWPEFVGSLNMLGRGIGIRTMTSLYDALQGDVSSMRDPDAIVQVPGFDYTTANSIADNIDQVLDLIKLLEDAGKLTLKTYSAPTAPTGSRFAGKALVFTGFRDASLEKAVQDEGGTIKSGISSSVHILVCADASSASGKAKKARELGIEIIDKRELQRRLFT